jgi:hypothetical protein
MGREAFREARSISLPDYHPFLTLSPRYMCLSTDCRRSDVQSLVSAEDTVVVVVVEVNWRGAKST